MDHSTQRYRYWYEKLIRLYPKAYQDRFGEGMGQTFGDLLRERRKSKAKLWSFMVWVFLETSLRIIRENINFIIMQNIKKRLMFWGLAVVGVLMIPLISMQFSSEVDWGVFDFVFIGVILFGSATAYELISRRFNSGKYRMAVALAAITTVLLLWINGAVGIIGDGPINMVYMAVVAVAFIGTLLARLDPKRMSYALYVTALAQALVPVLVSVFKPEIPWGEPGVFGTYVLNTVFAAMWLGSGLLFNDSSKGE